MDENDVRSSVAAVGDALVAGDIDTVIGYLSDELQRNPGEVVAMLPLPATETELASLERASAATVTVLRVVGETAEDELQLRWKDRDGEPRIVEVSHLSRMEREAPLESMGEGGVNEGQEPPAGDAAPA